MPILRAMVVLAHDGGQAEDVCVNTFHFDATAPLIQAQRDAVIAAVRDFYSTVGVSGSNIASQLGVSVHPEGSRIKLYDLSGPPPHFPIEDVLLNLTATASTQLPREVALVLSFQANPVSGQIQKRRRGRVFIGPLSTAAATYQNGDSRPTAGLMNALRDAAERLRNPAGDPHWVVRSGTGLVVPVQQGWVDNSFDTQRRRGLAPTQRFTY